MLERAPEIINNQETRYEFPNKSQKSIFKKPNRLDIGNLKLEFVCILFLVSCFFMAIAAKMNTAKKIKLHQRGNPNATPLLQI